jgi:hypothetical protein
VVVGKASGEVVGGRGGEVVGEHVGSHRVGVCSLQLLLYMNLECIRLRMANSQFLHKPW